MRELGFCPCHNIKKQLLLVTHSEEIEAHIGKVTRPWVTASERGC